MAGNGADPVVILLVEDNPDDVELTRIAMEDAGIDARLEVVADGREALAFLRGDPPHGDAPRPDLVLLDLNLPQLDGRELLRIVKADPDLSSIPVVVLTTSVDDNDVVEAYRAHANSFISKPADFGSYVETLRAVRGFWLGVAVLPGRW